MMLLKGEGEIPPIVVFPDPLKLTEPVPALNVPLLSQLPFTSRLIVGLKLSEPPTLIVMFKHAVATSTLTTVPAAIITSSLRPGTPAPPQVFGSLQSPALVDVNVAKNLAGR